ncbi:hypothetical protein ACFL96_19335 [Thermoproteota archaeon]
MSRLEFIDNILKFTQVTGFISATIMLPYFWFVGPTPGVSIIGGLSINGIPISNLLPWMILSLYGMHARGAINIIIEFYKAKKR